MEDSKNGREREIKEEAEEKKKEEEKKRNRKSQNIYLAEWVFLCLATYGCAADSVDSVGCLGNVLNDGCGPKNKEKRKRNGN